MSNNTEQKAPELVAKKKVERTSPIRIALVALFAIIAVVSFICMSNAQSTNDAIVADFDKIINDTQKQHSDDILKNKDKYEEAKNKWAEENKPEVLEEFGPKLEEAKAELKKAKAAKNEGAISEWSGKVSTYEAKLKNGIDPFFKQEEISKQLEQEEKEMRAAQGKEIASLNTEKDEALVYPIHVVDLFSLLAYIFAALFLFTLAAVLGKRGYAKGSTKLLEIVPFFVLIGVVFVIVSIMTALSFSEHLPANITADFGAYFDNVMNVL